MNEEIRLRLCISFWEVRKIRGWMGLFFPWHNLRCEMKAAACRAKLEKLQVQQRNKFKLVK
jgi:hypothetical protein